MIPEPIAAVAEVPGNISVQPLEPWVVSYRRMQEINRTRRLNN